MHLSSVSRCREVRVMKEVGIEFRSPWMNIIVVGGWLVESVGRNS